MADIYLASSLVSCNAGYPEVKGKAHMTALTLLLLLLHPFNGPSSGTTRMSWYQIGKTRKVKLSWIYWKQEIVSDSGISWAICKSAPRPRQITMPASHGSVFAGIHVTCLLE